MKNVKFIIIDPMGNITALVTSFTPKSRRSLVTKKIMDKYPEVEQVGFIDGNNFQMMGGELSINGTLAAGYYLSTLPSFSGLTRESVETDPRLREDDVEKIEFCASGVPGKVTYFPKKNLPTISLSIPCQILKIDGFNFVNLGEIGYFVQPRKTSSFVAISEFEKFREKFEKRLSRNAWGVVFYEKNRIWPVVYVKDSQGKVLEKRLEMACGSGSLAYSLILREEKIVQPSGKIIRIEKKENQFEISGRVKILASQDVVLRS